jgi:hypothetical protein
VPANDRNNSQYVITTEHSFYVSPFEEPTEFTSKFYIQFALEELMTIMDEYCPSRQECTLDNNTKRNITEAISLIQTALGFFEADGNHLKIKKGLNFYDNMTAAVNDIYSYLDNPGYGGNINQALAYLIEGSYKLAVLARDEAEEGDCQESNCGELLKNANAELGKAIDESKQDNYVYIFNHLTNAWKFAKNMTGANLKKETAANIFDDQRMPTEYSLGQNYPNPFNPATRIDFQLPEKKYVSLKIYDVQGNLVSTLVDQELEAGYHGTTWDASGFASGVYFYRFTSGSFIATKRLLLLK